MPKRRPVAAAATILALAALSTSARSAPPVTNPLVTPATVVLDTSTRAIPYFRSFPVYGADGRQAGSRTWMLTSAVGNCCEVNVVATPGGRLLDFGGSVPYYSDDAGKTWYFVSPATPVVNGEGSVTVAPDGDVRAVGWDAYGGDHLQAFVYDAARNSWSVGEVPVHTPFFDRPWITLAHGPFTIDGQTCEYPSFVGGGFQKSEPLASCDGLTYTQVTTPGVAATAPSGPLPVVPDPSGLADYWSTPTLAQTAQLSGRGLLLLTPVQHSACIVSELQPDGSWLCYQLPGSPFFEALRQDSRGWLTTLTRQPDGKALKLNVSTDGGGHWAAPLTLSPPTGGVLEVFDVHVNGSLGVAAVVARFKNAQGAGQDMLFQVDVSRPAPRLVETDVIGKGDIATANALSATQQSRFDFMTVAILPDGAIVGSYDDSTTRSPAMFVEQGTRTYRPDATITSSTSGPYRGEGVYNATGAKQSVDAQQVRKTTRTFYLQAKNSGQVADRFMITGPGSQQGFVARYLSGTTDITSRVVNGTYLTDELAPGATASLRLVVTTRADAVIGPAGSWLVMVSSQSNQLARDAVLLNDTVAR